MKKFILAAVLTAAAASPSFAATTHHHRAAVQPAPVTTDSYAWIPATNVVVQDGQVLGVDPDAFIRGQLAREGNPGDYSN